jgi:acetyl-CoA C-acetyltransferase
MQQVFVLGSGAVPVAEHYQYSLADLAVAAARAALQGLPADIVARIGAVYVGNAYAETLAGQSQLAAHVAAALGLSDRPAFRAEAAGASGGVALLQAAQAVAGGLPIALVIGVEKVTDKLEGAVEAALAGAADSDSEAAHGITLTAQWAMLMRRYMHEYGVAAADFAPLPVNAHANAAKNGQALYRFAINADKYRKANQIAAPLNMLDCSTLADGAAAVLLGDVAAAAEFGATVQLAGSALAVDRPTLHQRANPLDLAAARRSAEQALAQAGMSAEDVQVWELTDPHGIAAVLAFEAIGVYPRGGMLQEAAAGSVTPTGRTPLATAGGYKARGDVGGASGVYQLVELVRQLNGRAGPTQVAGAAVGLAQSLGGIGGTAVSHVVRRIN